MFLLFVLLLVKPEKCVLLTTFGGEDIRISVRCTVSFFSLVTESRHAAAARAIGRSPPLGGCAAGQAIR